MEDSFANWYLDVCLALTDKAYIFQKPSREEAEEHFKAGKSVIQTAAIFALLWGEPLARPAEEGAA